MIATDQYNVVRFSKNISEKFNDVLAIEEPIEIRLIYFINGEPISKAISITMRTPGNDIELAIGFLYTEGIINAYSQVAKAEVFEKDNNQVVTITIAEGEQLNLSKLERNFYTTSSCGVCGKSSIEAIKIARPDFGKENFDVKISPEFIYSLTEKLISRQNIFKTTGGLHASALFNFDGELVDLREDVGRHNALDKLIGFSLINELIPLNGSILLLSGRASFELIQKASMAGIKIVVAIGAPSSLAVDLAIETGITLIGFLRNEKFNIYSNSNRIEQ